MEELKQDSSGQLAQPGPSRLPVGASRVVLMAASHWAQCPARRTCGCRGHPRPSVTQRAWSSCAGRENAWAQGVGQPSPLHGGTRCPPAASPSGTSIAAGWQGAGRHPRPRGPGQGSSFVEGFLPPAPACAPASHPEPRRYEHLSCDRWLPVCFLAPVPVFRYVLCQALPKRCTFATGHSTMLRRKPSNAGEKEPGHRKVSASGAQLPRVPCVLSTS